MLIHGKKVDFRKPKLETKACSPLESKTPLENMIETLKRQSTESLTTPVASPSKVIRDKKVMQVKVILKIKKNK